MSKRSVIMARSPKRKTSFMCDSCGNDTPKWEGRCSSCGTWNSIVEVNTTAVAAKTGPWFGTSSRVATELSEVSTVESPRMKLSLGEVNRVLGGGIVPASATLVAGDPGIGKSTILLKIAADLSTNVGKAVYVTGEESSEQIKMRADRMGITGDRLYVLPATDLADIMGQLDSVKPSIAIIDSIQTTFTDSVQSEPGSVSQIRECARRLTEWAKVSGTAVLMSGHVTKGGDIAGPRILEHMVDVVLYLEGDPVSEWRLLRAVKNRFGSTNEIGVFEMTEKGLVEVTDPSSAMISMRARDAIGSIVVPILEGSRPLLIEVQALTSPSYLPTPRRVATGFDNNRLLLICAVLARRAGVPLGNQDVIVNITGGVRVSEPAADLGVALAIASSVANAPINQHHAAVGEIGLTGEIRSVSQIGRRVGEASRLGFARCLVPPQVPVENSSANGIDVQYVSTVSDSINAFVPITSKEGGRRSE